MGAWAEWENTPPFHVPHHSTTQPTRGICHTTLQRTNTAHTRSTHKHVQARLAATGGHQEHRHGGQEHTPYQRWKTQIPCRSFSQPPRSSREPVQHRARWMLRHSRGGQVTQNTNGSTLRNKRQLLLRQEDLWEADFGAITYRRGWHGA